LSTIGSGVLGAVQAEAPTKGKAGHGKAGEASGGGDFAMAVESLRSRDGEGGRLSISGNGDRAGGARAKAGHRDAQALAEALGKAGGDVLEEGKSSLDGKTRAAAQAGGRTRMEGHEAAGNTEAAEGEVDPNAPTTGETDVGNLLDLLATPNAALPHAGANGAAAFGIAPEGKIQSAGKTAAKADMAGKADATDTVEADGGEVPQSETDKLFRLIRADGKGRDLDVSIGDERASFRDASPTGPKGETVTVVDSRRYIGLAQAGNAAAVTSAITQDPEWTASLSATGGLSHSEAAATGKVVNTLKIQMHPIELGLVTATLRLHGDELVVSLQVETGEAYRQLADDQDAIVRALRGHGFAVDQVSVQLAPADRSAGTQGDGQGQQAQQQFSSQPQAREGGNGRGQRGDEGTFGREGRSHEGNVTETAAGLAGGQSGRSGGVYL
jgi:chemotaxis protein MotD